MSPRADLIIYNIGSLYACAGGAPRRGEAMRELPCASAWALASHEGRIVFVGPERELNEAVTDSPQAIAMDARNRAVLPGFVDPHNHLVYAGDRFRELRERLAGASYQDVAARGGGILSTVRSTRDASRAELVEAARQRLDRMLLNGTTTSEAKSGYGLTTETELLLLEVVAELDRSHPVDLVPTFLGAHEVPLEYRQNRSGYLELLIEEMIPEVARSGLAEWCDVFCEVGVFSEAESRQVLRAARKYGLKLRVHADEFASSGGTRLAIELAARSADHLLRVSLESIEALGRSDVVATVLPAASFYLQQHYAPARALVDAGAAVALGTDLNPGGGFSPSMPFAMTLAAFGAGLSLEEVILASTVNAAYAVDRYQEVGSLEVGKKMDALVLGEKDPACLIQVGTGAIDTVVKTGKPVVEGGRLLREVPAKDRS